jgi:hypothetical protein
MFYLFSRAEIILNYTKFIISCHLFLNFDPAGFYKYIYMYLLESRYREDFPSFLILSHIFDVIYTRQVHSFESPCLLSIKKRIISCG